MLSTEGSGSEGGGSDSGSSDSGNQGGGSNPSIPSVSRLDRRSIVKNLTIMTKKESAPVIAEADSSLIIMTLLR